MNFVASTFRTCVSSLLAIFAAICLQSSMAYAGQTAVSANGQKAVLVTGASSGIGRSIAETLAGRGVYVFAGARKPADLKALSAIKNIQGVRLDVTKQDEIDQAANLIKASGRGLHGVVNNAGVFFHAPLIEVGESEMQFMMDVNMFGPYRVSKAMAPLIIESRGHITTVGSIAGTATGPLMGPYAMSKGAMQSYTDALSYELKKFGVGVSIVDPGNFRSNIMANLEKRRAGRKSQKTNSLYAQEYERFANFTKADRSHHADPIAVAEAVYDALFSQTPKRRYMVTPNLAEAKMTISAAAQRLVELNHDQPFSLSREELIQILDAQLSALGK